MPGPGAYGDFSEFDRFAHPMEKEKYNPMNKSRKKLKGASAAMQFQQFLKRQLTVDGGVSQYDDDGKLLDFETRKANAKKAREHQRKKMEELFARKAVLLKEKEQRQREKMEEEKRRKAIQQKIAEDRRIEANKRLARKRDELRVQLQHNQAKIMVIKERRFKEERMRQEARRVATIQRHKERDAKPPEITPGPGQYTLPDQATAVTGGTWGKYSSKSEIELIEHRAAQIPAPGHYTLPDQATAVTGGTWGTASGKSDLERRMDEAREQPGPGQYSLPDLATDVKGGTWGTGKPKSDVEIACAEAAKMPGPGEYQVLSQFDIEGSPEHISKFKRSVGHSVVVQMHAKNKFKSLLAKKAGKKH